MSVHPHLESLDYHLLKKSPTDQNRVSKVMSTVSSASAVTICDYWSGSRSYFYSVPTQLDPRAEAWPVDFLPGSWLNQAHQGPLYTWKRTDFLGSVRVRMGVKDMHASEEMRRGGVIENKGRVPGQELDMGSMLLCAAGSLVGTCTPNKGSYPQCCR